MREEVIIQIPARGGSKRVKSKNLRYLAGKPMVAYAIEAAINSGLTENVYVNTDDKVIATLAEQLGAKAYMRPKALGGDDISGDEFNYDFMTHFNPQNVMMVSPVCPLIESEDIINAYQYFKDTDYDTVISSCSTKMQTFCDNEPVNIKTSEKLAPSQLNSLVTTLNWAVTIWDVDTYIKNYHDSGYAYLGKKRSFFDIDEHKAVKVSVEKDFKHAELLLGARSMKLDSTGTKYWEL
ncbi:MAG: cytidylyltransferase domain-containing protein [Bacteroidota bacterium]